MSDIIEIEGRQGPQGPPLNVAQLPDTAAVGLADELVVQQSGTLKRVTTKEVFDSIVPALPDATSVGTGDEVILHQGGVAKRATANELVVGALSVPSLPDATTVYRNDELLVQQGGTLKRATSAELVDNAIPQLTAATTVNPSDELMLQQSGTTKRVTAEKILDTALGNVASVGLADEFIVDQSGTMKRATTKQIFDSTIPALPNASTINKDNDEILIHQNSEARRLTAGELFNSITPQLADATSVGTNDEIIVHQSGVAKRATASELAAGLVPLTQVTATGSTTQRFLGDRFADALNVKDFGAVGDGKIVLGGSISSGSSTLTVTGGSFVAGDVGKQIVIEGAGSNKNSLFTTIGSVLSATQVGLGANASSTVSNRRVVYGTDDSDAIRAAQAAGLSQGRSVSFPTATYLLMKTSNGNTHTQFQNPATQGAFIQYVNSTTSVSKTFALFGNGSTLLSPVYPTTNGAQIGGLTWISVDGRWDNSLIDGFNFVCTHPLVESRIRGEATFFTIGSTVAILCYWDGFGNASEFGINRPNNLVVQNCQSKDFNHFLNAWAANNLTIRNNVITAEYGYPSTGNGDEINQSITTRYAVGGVVVENNLFNGCTANDVSSITMAPSSFQGKAYPQDGLLYANSRGMTCRNNIIVRYGFEGISANTTANQSASVTNNFFDNAFPIGAGRREEQSIACNGQDITVSENFIQNSQLGISTYFDSANSNIAILNNTVNLLPLKENSVWLTPIGIYLGSANNSIVRGNAIFGRNIGNINGQQNWDGSIATIPPGQPPELDIATGIVIVGNKTPTDGENIIENNYIAIESRANQNITVSIDIPSSVITWANHGLPAGTPITFKTTGQLPTGLTAGTSYYIVNPSTNSFQVSTIVNGAAVSLSGSQFGTQTASVIVLINAFKIGSGAGNYLIKNNTANNCDFLYSCGRGGVTMTLRFDSNVFNNGQRLISKWGVYPQAFFINSPIEFRPTETGWYICDSFPSNAFRVNSGRIGINVSSNSWYPDVVDSALLPKVQSTELEYGFVTDFSDPQTPLEIMVMNQISHTGNPDCAITKAYLVSDAGRQPQLYLYVNHILNKIRIRFLGGNGNAIGECAVVNGVATGPVTITTAGSGYSSGNTFGDLSIGAYGQNTFIKSKTEPIFNLTVAGGTVTGATITNGGSGLSQPIYIESKAATLTNEAWWSVTNILKSATPTFGYEMEFRLGTQCIRRRRGGNLIVGTGTPQFSNVPPASIPKFIGDVYFDENDDILYIAHGTSSSSDWKAIATWNP